jgi:hypothetical protein
MALAAEIALSIVTIAWYFHLGILKDASENKRIVENYICQWLPSIYTSAISTGKVQLVY